MSSKFLALEELKAISQCVGFKNIRYYKNGLKTESKHHTLESLVLKGFATVVPLKHNKGYSYKINESFLLYLNLRAAQ